MTGLRSKTVAAQWGFAEISYATREDGSAAPSGRDVVDAVAATLAVLHGPVGSASMGLDLVYDDTGKQCVVVRTEPENMGAVRAAVTMTSEVGATKVALAVTRTAGHLLAFAGPGSVTERTLVVGPGGLFPLKA